MIDSYKYHKANRAPTMHAAETCMEYFPRMLWRSDGEDTILDIGCADGTVTEEVLEALLPGNYKTIVGIDVDREFIRRARQRNTNEKISYRTQDISGNIDLELLDMGKFDHITSFLCLHWVENKRRAFQNIYDLLADDGDCLFTFSTNSTLHKTVKIMSLMDQWKHCFQDTNLNVPPFTFERHPAVNLRNILMEVGFRHIGVETKPWAFEHENILEYRNFLKLFHPFEHLLSAEEYEKYMDDVLEVTRILDNHPPNCPIFRGNYITIHVRK